jgi:hypothetical protein
MLLDGRKRRCVFYLASQILWTCLEKERAIEPSSIQVRACCLLYASVETSCGLNGTEMCDLGAANGHFHPRRRVD